MKKILKNKYEIDSLTDERVLACEEGYRLIEIQMNLENAENDWLDNFMNLFTGSGVDTYYYDGSYDEYGFYICVAEEDIKSFNKIWKEVKKDLNKELKNNEISKENKKVNTMNLKELVNETQEILEEGCLTIWVYRIGKSWGWTFMDDEALNDFQLLSEEKQYEMIESYKKKFKDQHGLKLNGYEDLANYTKIGLYNEIRYRYESYKQADLEYYKKSEWRYTYRTRGYSIGCQPMDGLKEVIQPLPESNNKCKFETLIYDRELAVAEIKEYELIDLNIT